jgi:hypothetical protein
MLFVVLDMLFQHALRCPNRLESPACSTLSWACYSAFLFGERLSFFCSKYSSDFRRFFSLSTPAFCSKYSQGWRMLAPSVPNEDSQICAKKVLSGWVLVDSTALTPSDPSEFLPLVHLGTMAKFITPPPNRKGPKNGFRVAWGTCSCTRYSRRSTQDLFSYPNTFRHGIPSSSFAFAVSVNRR